MTNINITTTKMISDTNDVVARIRTFHQKILATIGAALPFAMDAGDLLIAEKKAAGHGNWLPFLRDCGLKTRTAQSYMQLAAARDTIEAQMRSGSAHLSIAEALRLIRPKKSTEQTDPDEETPAESTPESTEGSPLRLACWTSAVLAERQAFLAAIGLPALLANMPAGMIKDMNELVRRQDQRAPPNRKPTLAWAQAMSLPPTERPRFDLELKAGGT
jgi:hypothetical protein